MSRCLWLMVARGGSKGVPRKNLRVIGGKSLIRWKAEAAKPLVQAGDSFVMSTEDSETAEEALSCGVDSVIDRPAELASDTASSASVIQHALETLGGAHVFDRVMLLEPSSPFATTEHLRAALAMYDEHQAHLVVGMKRVEPSHVFVGEQPEDGCVTPIIVRMERAGKHLRRQDLREDWTMSGSMYLFSTAMFRETGSLYGGSRCYGILLDRWHSLEIDSMEDLELAEYAYQKGYAG